MFKNNRRKQYSQLWIDQHDPDVCLGNCMLENEKSLVTTKEENLIYSSIYFCQICENNLNYFSFLCCLFFSVAVKENEMKANKEYDNNEKKGKKWLIAFYYYIIMKIFISIISSLFNPLHYRIIRSSSSSSTFSSLLILYYHYEYYCPFFALTMSFFFLSVFLPSSFSCKLFWKTYFQFKRHR